MFKQTDNKDRNSTTTYQSTFRNPLMSNFPGALPVMTTEEKKEAKFTYWFTIGMNVLHNKEIVPYFGSFHVVPPPL